MSDSVPSNFIRVIMEEDLRSGRHQQIVTRFPPEPNGYLHIGHAKAICIGFGLAAEFGGRCHLRMDDTNPEKEDVEYVESIERDIRWLGFEWGDHRYNASDYFGQLYEWAVYLIDQGHAYVDEQSLEEIRENRGTVEVPGTASPWRDRPAEESRQRLEEMRRGDHPDGAMVLRAKIDMAHNNMKLRDPVMYRIRNVQHHRTGDDWHIYPMYDWAHGQSDAIEGVTHSLCSLEFDVNRPLYDWFVEHLPIEHRPHQYEFARLNIGYTVLSKRKLIQLVTEKHVHGWDDPRMPTIAGLRRRGVPAAAVRDFIEQVGVSKANSTVDPLLLENAIRTHLNHEAPRVMVVLDPIEVVVDNWEGSADTLEASLWPHDVPREGTREVPFSGRLFLERSDFEAEPRKGFKRLAPGRAVRLRYAFIVTYASHEVDADGRVTRIHVTVDRETRGGTSPDGVKVWSTLHWVDAPAAVPVEVRLYDRLFAHPSPGTERDFLEDINPDSLRVVEAMAEPSLAQARHGDVFQFERTGYFAVDPDATDQRVVFNRVVPLKDTWSKRTAPSAPSPKAKAGQKPKAAKAPVADVPRELGSIGQGLVGRGLSQSEAATLESDDALRALFDAAVAVHDNPKGIAGWVVTEVAREAKEHQLADLPFNGAAIGKLVALIDAGTLSHAMGKKVFQRLVTSGGDPEAIVEAEGLRQIADPGELRPIVADVLGAHPDRVEAFRGGRTGLLGFFIGQVMQRTGGRANPELVRDLVNTGLSER